MEKILSKILDNIRLIIFLLCLSIVIGLGSYANYKSDKVYKDCINSEGLLIQEYGSSLYYCAKIERIKL